MKRSTYFKKRSVDIHKWVGQYEKVSVWISKLQNKESNAFNLYRYCEWSRKNPNELLALKENTDKEAEYLLDRFVADKTLNLTNHARNNIVMSVRSFYTHNYSDLASEAGKVEVEKIRPYRLPTKQDIQKLRNAAYNPRDRSLVSFMASTAIARGTLPHLKFSHLEKDWKNKEIPHISLPSKIIKGRGRGRYKGVRQETFLTPLAKVDLIQYIEWMEKTRNFEFKEDSVIFLRIKKPYTHLTYSEFGVIAARLSEKSGVPFAWHDMRRHVQTSLEEARTPYNWCRKIRGRKVKGQELPYSRPKIEQLREAFRSALPSLSIAERPTLSEEQILEKLTERFEKKRIIEDFARQRNIPVEKVEEIAKKFDLMKMKMKPMAAKLREIFLKDQTEDETITEDCQLIITEEQLEDYLKKGFRFVSVLPSEKILISNE